VFVYPQPRERVRAKYVQEYNLADHFGPWAPRKRVLYERRLARLPAPAPGHDRLCDVGCGDGQFLELAMARGWTAHGVELNPPAAEAARARGAVVVVGVIEEIDDLPWGSFDVVTSWDVLEHTPDPGPFSERLARLLAPGGTLVVTTLNYDSLVRLCFGWRWSMVCDDHFTYWNARSLRTLFESRGLRLVDARSFGLGRDFVTVIDRFMGRRRASRAVTASPAAAPPPANWDVNRLVLAAEGACNQVLNLTGSGVGVEATFTRP
jgi:2-polyprenyl-3-methyl-5-hydroxy-6-metoxy-1,4-benzoquinol methylase